MLGTPKKSTGKTPQKTPSTGRDAVKEDEKGSCVRCIAAFALTVVALIAVVVILRWQEIIGNKGTVLIFVIAVLVGVVARFGYKTFCSGCSAKAKKE
jgi:K+-sensing histidine kinase KdpD